MRRRRALKRARGGPGVRPRRGPEPMPGLIVLLQALLLAVSGPPSSPEYLPIRVAEAEGYFAAEGLAVTIRTTRAESGAAEALAQGQADLAATTLEAILRFGLRATNQAPRLIFGLTAAPPVALLVAGPHTSAVRSIEDLSALRVGVTTPGAPEHAWFGWLLARAGISIARVRVISIGGPAPAAVGLATRKAYKRLPAAVARDLAHRLSTRVVGEFADFEARLTASRGLYLTDGLVSADQLQQTISIIRTHTPLPQSVKIPRPEDMLIQIKPSAR